MEHSNIFIFGDSHSKCFVRPDYILKYNNILLHNLYKSSSTMIGLNKFNNSKLKYGTEIEKFVSKINKNDFILFMSGHVDIHYNLIYKKLILKKEIIFEEFIKDIIQSFITFINNLKKYTKNIIICGAVPCVEQNNVYKYYYFQKPYNINIIPEWFEYQKQFLRTILFNKELKNISIKNSLIYIDYINETCNKLKGIWSVKDEFVCHDEHFKGAETHIMKYPLSHSEKLNTLFIKKLYNTLSDINSDKINKDKNKNKDKNENKIIYIVKK